MSNPIFTQKALDGISKIILTEVLNNMNGFFNKVASLSKDPKKVQSIINNIISEMDDKNQESIESIVKRQENEINIIKERNERNKLPKCEIIRKKDNTVCNKPCKSKHTRNGENVCDEHFKQLDSYRDETCCYDKCGDNIKKEAIQIDSDREVDGVCYKDKFLCVRHYNKVIAVINKLENPCKFVINSKDGEKMCGELSVEGDRCKKHVGKNKKEVKKSKKDESKKDESVSNSKKSKKTSKKEENEEKDSNKKASKKDNEDKKETKKKKGSKKDDEKKSSKDEKKDEEIAINFKGKRKLNWIAKKDNDDEDIYIDANSGLVAVGDDEEKTVYGIWNIEENEVEALTEEAEKYAKKHDLYIDPQNSSTQPIDDFTQVQSEPESDVE